MRQLAVTFALLAALGSYISVAGTTQACGEACTASTQLEDEAELEWTDCGLSLECLRE